MPKAVISRDWEHLPHFHIILLPEQENFVDPEIENKLCKTLSESELRINTNSGLGGVLSEAGECKELRSHRSQVNVSGESMICPLNFPANKCRWPGGAGADVSSGVSLTTDTCVTQSGVRGIREGRVI